MEHELSSTEWSPPSVFDEYRVIRMLGRGGMGSVYLAYDTLLERLVALKFVQDTPEDDEARHRFLVEARAAARLSHPNVVTVHRVGELAGRPFIVSEFIQGQPLDVVPKPVPWQRALAIGVDLSRGLAAAHARGVLHRDIKPGNAILSDDGSIKLVDFGLAKLVDMGQRPFERISTREPPKNSIIPAANTARTEDDLESGCTASNEQITLPADLLEPMCIASCLGGTPHYMAPEVWLGEPTTSRADVYSLGVVLFELCAGVRPFEGVPLHKLFIVSTTEDAPSLKRNAPVDARFAAIVARCLRRAPAERFDSAEELREALEQLLATARICESAPEGNPYPGLSPFEAAQRSSFFGRSAETDAVLGRLRDCPLLVVAGDSGIGKSSLCHAAILPSVAEGALGEGRIWSVSTLSPGKRPIRALADALTNALGGDAESLGAALREDPASVSRDLGLLLGAKWGLLIHVDPLEELVTQVEPAEAKIAAEALAHLAAGVPGLRVLATLRADFIPRVSALPRLGDALSGALHFLDPLSPDRIREAIVRPAHARGVSFESDELVDELCASTTRGEGLPLLGLVLAELWALLPHVDAAITAASLRTIGGVAGVLARHADRVVLGLPLAQRMAARRVLTTLLSSDPTRKRTAKGLCSLDPFAREALDALVQGRLLVVHGGHPEAEYDIAHDTLRKEWETLRQWCDEQDERRIAAHRLEAASAEWERLGRAREALWTGRQLEHVDVVVDDTLGPRERAFLLASRAAERRRRVTRWGLATGLPVVVLLLWGAVRLQSARTLERNVHIRMEEAEVLYQQAGEQSAAANRTLSSAFAAFDGGDVPGGETAWSQSRALATQRDRTLVRAGQALETALLLDGKNVELRGLLGDTLLERALAADAEPNPVLRDELLARMSLYDESQTRRRWWNAPARIDLVVDPPGAAFEVTRYVEGGGSRRRETIRDAGPVPSDNVELPPGSYLFTFAAEGRALVRYPVLLHRGERLHVGIVMPPASDVPPGFVYVPAGRFLFGSSLEDGSRRGFLSTVPVHAVHIGPYLIARQEVTYAEWIEYLRALPPEERAKRTPRIGQAGLGGALHLRLSKSNKYEIVFQPAEQVITAEEGQRVTYHARRTRKHQDWLRFPVSGITRQDAEAYAAWLDRTGRIRGARICTEYEWERAARGADEREYPHGDALAPEEANFDETYEKVAAGMGPDEVGSHPSSQSPFGLDDMAGNALEWTTSSLEPKGTVVRGGAYFFDRMTARSTNRTTVDPNLRDPRLGVRLCASVAGSTTESKWIGR